MKKAKQAAAGERLTEQDWNFENVPEQELHVCCLWEYARESAFLRSVHERATQAARLKMPLKQKLEFVGRDFRKVCSVLGRSSILFQEGLYGFGGQEHFPDFVSPFPAPWQSLSHFDRAVLRKTTEWSAKEVMGIPGFHRAHYAHAVALPKLFKPKSAQEVFGGDGSVPLREFYHAGHKLRSICPNYMSPNGQEVLLVEIDWGRFTNEQLVQEFSQWLKENDPPDIKRPDGRGRKRLSERVSLERLGILRLLHRHPLAELKRACPKAWSHYHSENRRWHRDAEKARDFYCEWLSFLPAGELPQSWPPKDGVLKAR